MNWEAFVTSGLFSVPLTFVAMFLVLVIGFRRRD